MGSTGGGMSSGGGGQAAAPATTIIQSGGGYGGSGSAGAMGGYRTNAQGKRIFLIQDGHDWGAHNYL